MGCSAEFLCTCICDHMEKGSSDLSSTRGDPTDMIADAVKDAQAIMELLLI